MSYATSPHARDEELSTLVLGTMRSPGVVKLSGHDRWKNWDVQKAKGQKGASSALQADDVGQFQATFYLAADEWPDGELDDFERWEQFRRVIESCTNGAKPKALPIYHPDLAENGFTEVTSGGIGGAVHDGKGGKSYTVKFLEYRPPKPAPAKKAAGAPAGATAKQAKPDPNAAAKAQLAALLAEARKP